MEKIEIKDWLSLVRRPARYIGGEVNSVKKDLSEVALTFGLAFPDAYEVGMSHLGIQILYQVLNARTDVACERVFAPWIDMEELLRDKGAPLSTLESGIALNQLDVLGFSLQYELSYTNILNMLELGSVSLYAKDRSEKDPLVIGGGPGAFNPEPVAAFFDAFLLGDGEEAVEEILDAVIEAKKSGTSREGLLESLARIKGVYVPSLFTVSYKADNTVEKIKPLLPGYERVEKRVVLDIDTLAPPIRPVVPFVETIHDRASVEIARGCTRGCRFCSAGNLYRPARERTPGQVIEILDSTIKNTGYDEVSLLSLSTGDYTLIEDLLAALMKKYAEERIAVSLPSMRVGTLSERLAKEIVKVRKTGFTLAPEAGTERLRTLVNKGISEEDLMKAAADVFGLGWKSLKLYFMTGLPTETEADIEAIAVLAQKVKSAAKKASGRKPNIKVSVSTFIPKPFTPFQWSTQISASEAREKQSFLRKRLRAAGLDFKWHDPEMSSLEGVFARGDRRLASVIERAFKLGCRFDGWSEKFAPELWQEAFAEEGIDTGFYISRERPSGEVFAWDHLSPGVSPEFLAAEYEKAVEGVSTPDCKVGACSDCGVCDHKVVKNRTVSPATDGTPLGSGPHSTETPERRAGTDRGPKFRLQYSKTGLLRFLGHLEFKGAVTRTVKRAGIPVAYSGGFHPLPRLSFTNPLPVGVASLDEYMDLELVADAVHGHGGAPGAEGGGLAPAQLVERLNREAPTGLEFLSAEEIPLHLPLRSANMAEYHVFLKRSPPGLDIDLRRIDRFLRDFQDKDRIIVTVEKKKKVAEIDIKPLVASLGYADTGEPTLKLVLRSGGPVNVRALDVVACVLDLSRKDASLIPILKTSTAVQ